MMSKTLKELERDNHFGDLQERRREKEHSELALFQFNEERDKGMFALKQLETLKVKIDDLKSQIEFNKSKKADNLERLAFLRQQNEQCYLALQEMPERPLT